MEFDNEKEPTLALITWPRACLDSSSRINRLLSFGICLAPGHDLYTTWMPNLGNWIDWIHCQL
ncbi:hypothetical protein SCLCIDRAFT_1210092 [Scleroderma citrinum Foug A]|uniref:Uncharacterized protein n=1 Tax=Scleroderma citrinum Foug A TaxID=1036808 RepID=A0A0C3EI28_9AGAM|nr:hypothetical protein SCLCIDRAFT_1210092 [Scleroderma citrinum Foug A]